MRFVLAGCRGRAACCLLAPANVEVHVAEVNTSEAATKASATVFANAIRIHADYINAGNASEDHRGLL